LKKWLNEPLLHFLVLGALIFALYAWLTPNQPGSGEIVLTRGQQEHLITAFSRTWQRPPTAAEFNGLVEDWLREEIAYRESRQMGLDSNDTIIRRRLRQKLETLADDIVSMSEPSDEQLQAYLQENSEAFQAEPRYTLQQVYFSPDRRGEQAAQDAEQALLLLNTGGELINPADIGDPLPLPRQLEQEREAAIAAQFGQVFVDGLRGLETGEWQGPLRSGYGLHLVRIERYSPGRPLTLDEARAQVQRDWANQQRQQAMDMLYQRLGERYTFTIEPLVDEPVPGDSVP
jgi:hypothetical protein